MKTYVTFPPAIVQAIPPGKGLVHEVRCDGEVLYRNKDRSKVEAFINRTFAPIIRQSVQVPLSAGAGI